MSSPPKKHHDIDYTSQQSFKPTERAQGFPAPRGGASVLGGGVLPEAL